MFGVQNCLFHYVGASVKVWVSTSSFNSNSAAVECRMLYLKCTVMAQTSEHILIFLVTRIFSTILSQQFMASGCPRTMSY